MTGELYMTLLNEILTYNETFVHDKKYEEFATSKFPNKRIVVLTCMDTRLTELLPKAMNFRNGDVKIVKSAGAVINQPFGGVMRSIIIAVYGLQADEVFIIGHHDCGMNGIDTHKTIEHMIERGISINTIQTLKNSGINLDKWLRGFNDVTESVRSSVTMVRNHPLMDKSVPVHGLVIDPSTGKLDILEDGYANHNSK